MKIKDFQSKKGLNKWQKEHPAEESITKVTAILDAEDAANPHIMLNTRYVQAAVMAKALSWKSTIGKNSIDYYEIKRSEIDKFLKIIQNKEKLIRINKQFG